MAYVNYKVSYRIDDKVKYHVIKDVEKSNNHKKIIDQLYTRIALHESRSTSVISLLLYKEA